MLPPAAGVNPVMTLNRVDLPDPLGPITASTPPSGTVSVIAFSATSPPKRTVTPFTSSSGLPAFGRRGDARAG